MGANLAVVPSSPEPVPAEPRIFQIFVSYASEDFSIAEAIGKCLKVALGDVFAEINMDKWFLQPGSDFKQQIESKLEKTDVLIIVYTGVGKPSHGYTGWEVGYFDRVMRTSSNRKKVAMFLDKPPAISQDEQGISLNIGQSALQLTHGDFEAGLKVDPDDPLCKLIETWQDEVAEIMRVGRFPKREMRPEQNAATCVKNLRLEIFRYLKTTVDITLKPQKQITVKAKGAALERSDNDLPPDSELVPMGSGGPMSIFGLPDVPTTWEKFLQSTGGCKYRDSWRDAITSVVMSSFPNKIDVDNSQVIVSNDEAKTYRIILTTATRYYDDSREFNLYFVEALRRQDYGDKDTTLLLKGLELVCRFRFLFLEDDSDFSYRSVQMTPPERLPEVTSRLQRELNLLRKDSRDAGLDMPNIWRRFVSWELLEKMGSDYGPREKKIRAAIAEILDAKTKAAKPEKMVELRQGLSDLLKDLEETLRPENTLLLQQMAGKLQEITGKPNP
jgi:TIR domain